MLDFQVRFDGPGSDDIDRVGHLILSGDLSIRNAQSFYQQILDAREKCSTLHIVLEQVTSTDLALLQILFALKRDAGQNVQFTIDERDSGVSKWLTTSGLTSLVQPA